MIRDRNGDVALIVEVENDPMRKVIVGASILADASVAALDQKRKPRLIFVIYKKQGIKQIPNFRDKVQIAIPYCRHLKKIEVLPETEFEERRPEV